MNRNKPCIYIHIRTWHTMYKYHITPHYTTYAKITYDCKILHLHRITNDITSHKITKHDITPHNITCLPYIDDLIDWLACYWLIYRLVAWLVDGLIVFRELYCLFLKDMILSYTFGIRQCDIIGSDGETLPTHWNLLHDAFLEIYLH